jgi:hypothetical protein
VAVVSRLRPQNVTVVSPRQSPGVLLADPALPMLGVVFEDVVVEDPPLDGPWGDAYYFCQGVSGGVATGRTWPVPPCFDDQTDAARSKSDRR